MRAGTSELSARFTMNTYLHISKKVLAGELVTPEDLRFLIAHANHAPHDLLHLAWKVRKRYFGRRVSLCCIVPGKLGGCSEDCKWCAQRATNMAVTRTASKELVQAADDALSAGAWRLGIVNSGRRPSQADMQAIAAAVREILSDESRRALCLCASLGELTEPQARDLRQAGVVRYHHNLETSRRFFDQVVSTHNYDDRLATLANASAEGLEICCGALFGIGESWDDRIDLALTLRDKIRPASVPLNFLHPIQGTPLEHAEPLGPMEILTIISLFRIAIPQVDIKIAGGRVANLRDMQSWIFYAGATSCMVGNYLTTAGRGIDEDLKMIEDLGLDIDKPVKGL